MSMLKKSSVAELRYQLVSLCRGTSTEKVWTISIFIKALHISGNICYYFFRSVQGEFGDKISEHTLTDHFSKPFRDTNPLLRCPFHNTDEGCDKKSCTEKNTKKYFYQLITVLADFLPEVDLGRTPNTHIFVPQEGNSKRKADRNIQNIRAPTNTPREHPGNPSLDTQPEPTPRPPHSYSARNKSLGKSCCTSSSNSTRSSSPVNNTFEDQLPRRPKPEKKNLANGNPVVKSKSSVTYDKDSLTYDTNNGASAVESSANCENQFSELPLSGKIWHSLGEVLVLDTFLQNDMLFPAL